MDWRLFFSGLQQPAWAVSTVVAALTAAALCLWMMRAERRLVSSSVGWILFGLRMSVIGLLLLVLLQPTVSLQETDADHPRVIIAADISGSMRTADTHSTAAEFLRWCQALGLLGNEQTSDQIDAWIASSQGGREPDWSITPDGSVAADVAESRRRHMEQLFADIGRTPRTQLVHRLLAEPPNQLIERLDDGFELEYRTFGAESHVVSDQQLLLQLQSVDENRADATDLAGLLDQILKINQADRCAGVVLLSDGRQTVSGDTVRSAQQLGSAGVPVFTVPIGSRHLPQDLIVQPVDAPGSVFPDDQVQVSSRIAAAGFDGQMVTVRLRRGEEVLEEDRLPVVNGTISPRFMLPRLEEGYHDLTLDAEVLPGELSDENNQQQFTIAVVDNRASVMLIDQDARWEFRYLNNLLDRDTRIDLTTYLVDQPFLELLDQPAMNRNVPPAEELRTLLAKTDLLILGDVSREAMSDAAWTTIGESVSDDGLTLAVIPGRRHTLEMMRLKMFRELMPVTEPERFLAEFSRETSAAHAVSGFQLVPTAASGSVPMFQLQSTGQDVRSIFRSLPGHPWILSGTPRPVASVWATADIQADDGVRSAPLIVHHYFGSGQVIWMGMDSTWRWRRRAGDAWHHRFWGQFVRWAVRSKSAARSGDLQMHLSADVINEQQSADVSVRWSLPPGETPPVSAMRVTASPVMTTGASELTMDREPTSFVLNQVPGFTDRFAGKVSGLSKGHYRIQLDTHELSVDVDKAVAAGLTVVARTSPEFSDISCDRNQLQQLADESGGEILDPWELQQLPELLRADTPDQQQTLQEQPLWDHWSVLVAFFFLLMSQWVIRKQSGLP